MVGLSRVLLLSLICFSSIFHVAESHAAEPSIRSQSLTPQIWLLQGREAGTNIGLLRLGAEWLLIDPMPGKDDLPALQQHVRGLAGNGRLYLLNTHAHDDHSGGNALFIDAGAQLLDNAYGLSALRQLDLRSHTASDKVFHAPEDNVTFVGDVIDSNWHPTFYAGGLAGLEQAVESILQLGDEATLIVPGHGPVLNKSQARQFLAATRDWYARVQILRLAGHELPAIMADAELRAILERFNHTGRQPFLPEKAVQRFVERTLGLQSRQ